MQTRFSKEANTVISYAGEEAIALNNSEITPDHLLLGIIRHRKNMAYRIMTEYSGVDMGNLENALRFLLKEEPTESNSFTDTFSDECMDVIRLAMLEFSNFNIGRNIEAIHFLMAILHRNCGKCSEQFANISFTYDKFLEYTDRYLYEHKGKMLERRKTDDSIIEELSEKYIGNEQNTDKRMTAQDTRDIHDMHDRSDIPDTPGIPDKTDTTDIPANHPAITPVNTPIINRYGTNLTRKAAEGKNDKVVCRDKEIMRLAQVLGRRKKNNAILTGEPGVGKTAIVEGLAAMIADGSAPDSLTGTEIVSIDLGSMVAGTKFRGQFEERIKALVSELKTNPQIILFIDEIHNIIGAGGTPGSLDAANMLKPALANGEIRCIGTTTADEYRQIIEKDKALERRFQKITVEATGFDDTLAILNAVKVYYENFHKVKYDDNAIRTCINLSIRYITTRALPDKAIDVMDEAGSMVRTYCNKHADNDIIPTITSSDIAKTVSMISGIPVHKMTKSENEKISEMEKTLKQIIIGQDSAIETVCKSIIRSRTGLKNPRKPIGTFLFMGPTGVGKTQLAKKLAEYMFDSEESLIRIDMSEFMEKYSVSRLIGAPPGYVGYNEGGELSERVRNRPYSVVLLDEIEKAHDDIYNLLLQVMDEGRLTDSNGRSIDFRNTIIIMTSNIGTKELKSSFSAMGYSTPTNRNMDERSRNIISKALEKSFTPEFRNRIDEFVLFSPLSKESLAEIADIEIKEVKKRIEALGYRLDYVKSVTYAIAEKGYDPEFGARPVKRVIQNIIEDTIADMIINGRVNAGETIFMKTEGREIIITK